MPMTSRSRNQLGPGWVLALMIAAGLLGTTLAYLRYLHFVPRL